MSNVSGAQGASIKKQTESDMQNARKNIQDLGESVGDMASRQYERAQDAASDVLQETVGAIRRNPLAAIGIGFGVGFLYGVIKG
jgi:ElaB/YqjD/DUF883 family membrane-anchored ribosome-binding protein